MSSHTLRGLLFFFLAAAVSLQAQQPPSPCELTALSTPKPGLNIFTEQQEGDLGDVIAEQIPTQLRPIDAPELSERLSQIGDRLVKHLPPTGLHFRFYVSDSPVANALSIVGGRVYMTRKMIGLFQSEDELAGVLGHELGHLVTHQQAKLYTRLFNERLGVTAVTDRKDIFDKYNQLLDEWAKRGSVRQDPEEDQQEADRIGLEATVRAGYSPQALVEFWDRFTENKGRVGTWFSEWLQSTPPETKRYREMLKGMAALPAACRDVAASHPTESFHQWQVAAVNFHGMRMADSLHNLLWKKTLEPALQEVIHTLKFSPDGKYVLAQDGGNIFVLTRDPFRVLFRIDAFDAYPARFTPDSQNVVLYDSSLRVEKWNIALQQRTSVNEVYVTHNCMQTLLAPDGKTLACYRSTKDLDLVDVATGDHLMERKNFLEGKDEIEASSLASFRYTYTLNLLNLAFSPDGRFFVAALRNQNSVAFDIADRHEIPVTNALKPFLGSAFSFITPDRIVGYSGGHGEKSAIVEFPSGKTLRSVDLGGARPTPATHGDYILIRPIKDNAVGILDINANQIVGANKQSALDVYDKQYVLELKNGHLALFGTGPAPIAETTLARGSFGKLRSVAVSDDLNWLAVSGRGRGGVWSIPSSSRVLNLREFRGAYIGQDGNLLADFPRQDPAPRSIARVSLSQRQFSEAMRPALLQDRQEGPYVVAFHPLNDKDNSEKNAQASADSEDSGEAPIEGVNFHLNLPAFAAEAPHNTVLQVRQIQSGTLLWSRNFPKESPRQFTNWMQNTMVLRWPMSDAAAKAEWNANPVWKSRFPSPKEQDLLFEVLDLPTGKLLGGLVLNTGEGSFSVENAIAAGDWLVLHDDRRRVVVYSLATGIELGRVFGDPLAVSDNGGRLCLQNLPGKLELYDLSTMAKLDELAFASGVSAVHFVGKGKQLLVLTYDQSVYLFEPGDGARTTAAH